MVNQRCVFFGCTHIAVGPTIKSFFKVNTKNRYYYVILTSLVEFVTKKSFSAFAIWKNGSKFAEFRIFRNMLLFAAIIFKSMIL